MNRRTLGWTLLASGALLASIPIWIAPAISLVGDHTITRTPTHLAVARPASSVTAIPASLLSAPKAINPQAGSTVANLSIPSLGLNTSVIEGTSYSELLLDPGHYAGSVLPGENGTSVLAAHNATYFRHINELKPGSEIIVTTSQGKFWFKVTGHRVVPDTVGLPISTTPTLDLEACYPLDALYFTPDRYIVESSLVKDHLYTTQHSAQRSPSDASPYTTNIPAVIADHYSFSLTKNSLPMGDFTYQGSLSKKAFAYQQSDRPLQAATTAVDLWLAFRDASQIGNSQAVLALLPNEKSTPYWKAQSIIYEAPLTVELTLSARGAPETMTLSDTNVSIDETPYVVHMHISFSQNQLHISSIQFQPE